MGHCVFIGVGGSASSGPVDSFGESSQDLGALGKTPKFFFIIGKILSAPGLPIQKALKDPAVQHSRKGGLLMKI